MRLREGKKYDRSCDVSALTLTAHRLCFLRLFFSSASEACRAASTSTLREVLVFFSWIVETLSPFDSLPRCCAGVILRAFMRPFSPARLPPVLNSARLPISVSIASKQPLFLRPLPRYYSESLAPRSRAQIPFRRSPLSQISKRHCSYRRMCIARGGDVPAGTTNVAQGREVLPTNVKPVHYDLTLDPDFEKFTFDGTVVIEYVASA